ncbi:hypothetical protein OY671_011846, partial [Metschnikowia pulcherrima]
NPGGSGSARHQAAFRGKGHFHQVSFGRSAMGCALRDRGERGVAHAVHRADVQTPPIWRHSRHRHRHRQDAVGPPPWHGAPQRSVRRADDAAAHDRHAQQRRRGDDRQWPGIHRRRHRRPDKGDRSADGEDSVVGQSASRRPGDADHLPAGGPGIPRH